MAIVLRFVDKMGFVRKCFFDLVHVRETTSLTLKNEISDVLSHHTLNIASLRGQGYDGASNMRSEFKGLQALFLNDCPHAYFIHCFAHRLQLALVGAAKDVIIVYNFFSMLSVIVNIARASAKRLDELQAAYTAHVADMVARKRLETGRGVNQLPTLQRVGDTRWSSHLNSILSLLKLFYATCIVLQKIVNDGAQSQRAEGNGALDSLMSFEFVFILHLMKEVLGITHHLCQALQRKSQDILNAMSLVSSTKRLLQELREIGWEILLEEVESFCKDNDIAIPDMNAPFLVGRGRRHQKDHTVEHHYRVDIFLLVIDSQLQELNTRFKEEVVELLTLSSSLDPKNSFKFFNAENLCTLAKKYYPEDFNDKDLFMLRYELRHYEDDQL
ncbi:Zinc finger MYM-type protein 1 [Quillaja saponaria]|uniref:Zinc finger MYM-type protein 1 n=1 Tax=Quillaja saponaria TaxID=32244 RepID=A0AAD7PM04_QUISA|nr:Zinc finger MYM-type protein 1 [Quillaja saponaria]